MVEMVRACEGGGAFPLCVASRTVVPPRTGESAKNPVAAGFPR